MIIHNNPCHYSTSWFFLQTHGLAEFAGLENDGVEQEETYIHTAHDEVNAN